jgi:anhydro-N-acetylmuramic acid kinase
MAMSGKVDVKRVVEFENDPFFAEDAPKSLDRNHFSLAWIQGLSTEDGAATLTAMTAAGIAKACALVPHAPKQLLITGGGRHNTTMMSMIAHQTGKEVKSVEDLYWNGDALEAQAFAYLAARSLQGLALSLPTTTGVARPVTGGAFYPAALAGASSTQLSGAR